MPGSFRGVPFETTSADGTTGRRLAIHEFINRDLPYAEDLGRSRREYSLSMFVLGDDYFDQRDRLLRALETPGIGTLVHPTLGELEVVVQSVRYNERREDGRMATFNVTFFEAGRPRYPTAEVDTGESVTESSTALLTSAAATFSGNVNLQQVPGFIVSDFNGRVSQLQEDLRLTSTGGF